MIIFLVLLWTMHQCMAKRSIKAKYRETRIVNYRQDNNDANTLSTCTSIKCNEFRTGYDGQIDISRCKCTVGIQYKHESKEDITGFISKPVASVRHNLAVHCSVTPFIIRQPIWRPRLLETVFKPMHTLH